jgi:ATP-dependent Clp protease ATP-binding subunit ClpX
MAKDNDSCSFCGLPHDQARVIVMGITASICDDCTISCGEEIAATERKDVKASEQDYTPSKIVNYLDRFVIGQRDAKKQLAVAVSNHYKRCFEKLKTPVDKSNMWLIGGTGTGKTLLLTTVAKYLDIPFVAVDCTSITSSGYVGDDTEMILSRLLKAAEGSIGAAEKGIVLLDEVDKLAASDDGFGRDIKGRGVQQELLKMIEGDVVSINPTGKKKNGSDPIEHINTKDILFVLGGAFVGLRELIQPKNMGIGSSLEKEAVRPIIPNDLVRYGMLPELIGRVPIIAETEPLSVESMVRILTEPNDAITKQYQALLLLDGVSLKFSPEFLTGVAKKALEMNVGARAIRSIIEKALLELMFKAPDLKIARSDSDIAKHVLNFGSDLREVIVTEDYLK